MKSSVEAHELLNILQFLDVMFIITTLSAWLWIQPINLARKASISNTPKITAVPTPHGVE